MYACIYEYKYVTIPLRDLLVDAVIRHTHKHLQSIHIYVYTHMYTHIFTYMHMYACKFEYKHVTSSLRDSFISVVIRHTHKRIQSIQRYVHTYSHKCACMRVHMGCL